MLCVCFFCLRLVYPMLPASLDVKFWLPHRSSLTLIGINYQSNHSLNWRSLHLRLWNQRLSPQKLFTGCCTWCRKVWRYQKGNIAFGSYIRQVGGFNQGTPFPLQMKNNPLKITEMLLIKDQLLWLSPSMWAAVIMHHQSVHIRICGRYMLVLQLDIYVLWKKCYHSFASSALIILYNCKLVSTNKTKLLKFE